MEATAHNVGQTFLRRLYDRLHCLEGLPAGLEGAEFYYTVVFLTEEEWLDLEWWERALRIGLCWYSRSSNQNMLGITWGDGSGTGTGGTVQLVAQGEDLMSVEAWMGIWEPQVFHFSSNWKELRTLLHTLEREELSDRLRGCTVFYFTDNLVSYYIAHSGGSTSVELHKLIRRLMFLLIKLDIHLEVVHVPGRHMISQQTDGLSRGLAFSNSRLSRSPREELLRLFRGLRYTPDLIPWLMTMTGRTWGHRPLQHIDSVGDWSFHDVVGRSTVWTPSPEWADQIVSTVVEFWTEAPLSTEAFFVIPRIFQRRWGRKNKHIVDWGALDPRVVPGAGDSDIPFVILHLPCHIRSLPPPVRLDRPSQPYRHRWHSEQAEYVRGLQ